MSGQSQPSEQVPLIKYPRTIHFFDTGSASPDDLVLEADDLNYAFDSDSMRPIIVEEKIDGANLGLRIVDGEIIVQNRSHYLRGGEHAQFSAIPQWIDEHREALTHLLGSEKLILYGEWCVARHSLPYDRLPGYFVAFDLLDIDTNRFFSRVRFHTTMEVSKIPVVPTIGVLPSDPWANSAGTFKSISRRTGVQTKKQETILSTEFIRKLLKTQSAFRSDGGHIEGIVLRQDDGEWLDHRFKVVRPDFKAGMDKGYHWSRRKIEKQRIDFAFQQKYLQQCYPFSYSVAISATEIPLHDNLLGPRRAPRFIILAGLPGSGKSSFANSLAEALNSNQRGNMRTLVANQDLLGRKDCQRMVGQGSGKYRVIVDRCNLTTKDRKEWFQIMHSPSADDTALVYFNVPAHICTLRSQLRLGHPTMQQGKASPELVEQLSLQLEQPSNEERNSMFGTIHIISSWDEAKSLVKKWANN